MDYAQIAAEVKAAPQTTVCQANGQTLRAWEEGNYYVSLLFDKNDICLGVMEERGQPEGCMHMAAKPSKNCLSATALPKRAPSRPAPQGG